MYVCTAFIDTSFIENVDICKQIEIEVPSLFLRHTKNARTCLQRGEVVL